MGTGTGPRRFAVEPTAIHAFRATVYCTVSTVLPTPKWVRWLISPVSLYPPTGTLILSERERFGGGIAPNAHGQSPLIFQVQHQTNLSFSSFLAEEGDTIGPMNFHW